MDLKEIESGVNPDIHWYYQAKKLPLFRYIEKLYKLERQKFNIIDLGAGSGFFSQELYKNYTQFINNICLVDIGYTDKEIILSKHTSSEKRKEIPSNISHSLVMLMDVLEHVENDIDLLIKIKRASYGKNYFFITVPAFQSLWSSHDVYLGHYRRYEIADLQRLLASADFNITNIYYIYGGIYPLVWLLRKFKTSDTSDMKPVSPLLNFFLKAVNTFEINFRKYNYFFGVTCVAEGFILNKGEIKGKNVCPI